jgi:hypothetical protein
MVNLSAISQEYKISGTITGLENESVYLMQLMGEKRSIIDTAQTDITGAFTFDMPESRKTGMYVVIKGAGQAVELIYNKEDIQFITSGFANEDGIQVISSVENLIYYDYLSVKGVNMYKLDVLSTLLKNYPKNNDFYLDALKHYEYIQNQINNRVVELIENNYNILVGADKMRILKGYHNFNCNNNFNLYGCLWTKDKISIYFNRLLITEITLGATEATPPCYFILNMDVDDGTVPYADFKSEFVIDSFKHYTNL